MLAKAYKLLFSPRGRIARPAFIAGIAFLVVFTALQKLLFARLGAGMISFYVPMILFFVTLHIVLCIYGKRLHDLGRSLWPLTGMIAGMMIIAILVSLNFGGLEYFDTVMAHPEYAGDEAAMQQVQQVYQDKLAANMPKVRLLMAVLPALFTLWLAVKTGAKGDNKYGPA